MSADELRKAAETLRERAEAVLSHGSGMDIWFDADVDLRNAIRANFLGNVDSAADDACWISLMSPSIGLGLANAFEMTAIAMDSMGAYYPDGDESNGLWTDTGAPMYEWDATLAVARLINGDES